VSAPLGIPYGITSGGYPGGYCTVPVGTAAVRYCGWVLQGTAGYCWVLRVLWMNLGTAAVPVGTAGYCGYCGYCMG
jgi:hypothetical protein